MSKVEVNHETGQAEAQDSTDSRISTGPGPQRCGEDADSISGHESIPESSVAFRGWRMWTVKEGRLYSITRDCEWKPGVAQVATTTNLDKGIILTIMAIMLMVVVGTGFSLSDDYGIWIWPIWIAVGMLLVWRSGMLRLSIGMLRVWVSGEHVQPGNNTSGIYAFYSQKKLPQAPTVSLMGRITVAGTVDLWGFTIEHEDGVKGEYAYPVQIESVACVRCGQWMPLESYTAHYRPPVCFGFGRECLPLSRSRRLVWNLVSVECSEARWRNPGLNALRERVPEWFAEAGEREGR